MADIAELGLVVDANGGIRALEKFDRATQNTSTSVNKLEDSVKRSDSVLRRIAETGTVVSDTQRKVYADVIRANGGFERYAQIQRQIADEMRVADTVAQQYNTTMAKTETHSMGASRGMMHLQMGLGSIAAQATGTNSALASVTGMLGSMAVGSALTVGALADIAAIGYAYKRLTNDAAEARKKVDELTASLLRNAASARPDQIQAAEKVAEMRSGLAETQRRIVELSRPSSAPMGFGSAVDFVNQQKILKLQEDEITQTKALAQAQRELGAAHNERVDAERKKNWENANASWELEKSLAAQLKGIDDEKSARRKKELAERIKALKAYYAEQDSLEKFARQEEEKNFNASVQSAIRTLELLQQVKDEKNTLLGLNTVGSDAMKGIGQLVLDNLDADKAAGKYAKDMQAIWRSGIGRIVTDGTKSFRDFFEDVLRLFSSLMERMQKEGKDSGGMYKALGIGSSAIAGGFAGYQTGRQIGSAGLGAVGGAASGALSGFAIAGPMGAVAGGLTGLVGGLLGASSAASAAAKALHEMQVSLKDSIEAFKVQARGFATIQDQVDAVHASAEKLRDLAFSNFQADHQGRFRQQNDRYQAALEKIAAAEAEYIKRLEEESALKRKFADEDLNLRALRAFGDDAAAEAMAREIANQRELDALYARKADQAEIDKTIAVQQMEAGKRKRDADRAAADASLEAAKALLQKAEEIKKATDALTSSLVARGLSALGDSRGAEDARSGAAARQEMEDAIKAGMSPTTLAMLAFTQVLERWALEAQRQIEDQTKAINAAAQAQIDALDRQVAALQLIAQVAERAFNDQIASAKLISEVEQKAIGEQLDTLKRNSEIDQKAYSTQIDAIKKNSDIEQKGYQEQIDIAKDALAIAKDQLQTQQRSLDQTRRVLDSLTQFSQGLKLDTSLTTLSPVNQLSEARRQYEQLLAQANAGDRDAAGKLPGSAQSYLNASRTVNASGMGYVEDFKRVQESIAAVTNRFGAQATVEERILAELQAQSDAMQSQLTALQTAKDQARDSAQAQIDALQTAKDQARDYAQAQIDALQIARDNARESADAQINALELARDNARDVSDKQIAALQSAKDQARADADRAIQQMIEQVNAALQLKAQDSKFYEQYLENIRLDREKAVAYYNEALEKLAGIIRETFRTANNTSLIFNKPPPPPTPIPNIPFPPELGEKMDATNTELRASVGLLQAGFTTLNTRLGDLISAQLEGNQATRQGLEGARL